MRHKMISLDLTSWEIASKMDNFSLWVREKLAEEYNKGYPTISIFERMVPTHFICNNCRARGQHWSVNCPTLEEVEIINHGTNEK